MALGADATPNSEYPSPWATPRPRESSGFIRRLPPVQIAADIQADPDPVPGTMCKILRLQPEPLGISAAREVGSLQNDRWLCSRGPRPLGVC